MTRRINVFGACIVSSLCAILFYANLKYSNTNYKGPQAPKYVKVIFSTASSITSKPEEEKVIIKEDIYRNYTIEYDIIDIEREKIAQEMITFQEKTGKVLTELTLETNGAPIRSVIITTWRSGSTFLGDVLNAMPGNYYHYEPLLNYDIIQIRGPPYATGAINNIKKLLKCDYSDMDDYLEYGQTHNWLFTHNTRLWEACGGGSLCWKPKFLDGFCKIFPLQSMKIVRLRLDLAAQLLQDESLNVKIVLLIRDPRGTMQSRRHRDWCPGNPDCGLAKNLCSDMVADYHAAKKLQKQFPDRFRAIRYEDFSMDTDEGVNYLFDFYGLPVTEQVKKFLKSHTKNDKGGVSSTYRNSKQAPFHWRQDLSYDDVLGIQEDCMEALKLWDYNILTDASQLRSSEWNPISNYSITRATYL